MRKVKIAVLGVAVALSGLTALASPAKASCNEVGDPACTVAGVVNATTCTATTVAKSGGKLDFGAIADCFNQTT
jgi:hypothetical protein